MKICVKMIDGKMIETYLDTGVVHFIEQFPYFQLCHKISSDHALTQYVKFFTEITSYIYQHQIFVT